MRVCESRGGRMWLIGANLGYIIRIGRKYRDAHTRAHIRGVSIVRDLVFSSTVTNVALETLDETGRKIRTARAR